MSDVDRCSAPGPATRPDPGCHCQTCGDIAVPMEVLQVDEARALALCADGDGAHVTVEILLVGVVEPGERLLVHAGTAIARPEPVP